MLTSHDRGLSMCYTNTISRILKCFKTNIRLCTYLGKRSPLTQLILFVYPIRYTKRNDVIAWFTLVVNLIFKIHWLILFHNMFYYQDWKSNSVLFHVDLMLYPLKMSLHKNFLFQSSLSEMKVVIADSWISNCKYHSTR